MNLKFDLNDYVLIWNLLFQASISEEVQAFKQRLWKNYRHSYNNLYEEGKKIVKDPKNYIPGDDTIFDMVKNLDVYQTIKKDTDRYRMSLLKTWDEKKKEITDELKDILRFDIKLYHVLIVNEKIDMKDTKTTKGRINTITWGRRKDRKNYVEALLAIVSKIVHYELEQYQKDYHEIVEAVVELAVDNELYTRCLKKSVYLRGDNTLTYLKRQIYPYWLMYLGASKKEILNYMLRDNIAFDLDKYTYERQLSKLDLYEFINFCIKNQRHILKINEIEII